MHGIPNNSRPWKIRHRGFIALMSAIIIATILLLVATTGGLTGIFARGNALDAELKARSVVAADACVDLALLALANDPGFLGNDPPHWLNSLDVCRIGAVATVTVSSDTTYQFTVNASSGVTAAPATTNLEVVVNTTDLSVVSWLEVP